MNSATEHDLLLDIVQLHSKIQRQLNSALSVHGLGVSEFLVLQELEAAPEQVMRRIDLAERIGLTASGVTRLLNPMEKIGLVKKAASDRDARVSLVSLTRTGARILKESRVSVDDAARTRFGKLDAEQKEGLRAMLGQLH